MPDLRRIVAEAATELGELLLDADRDEEARAAVEDALALLGAAGPIDERDPVERQWVGHLHLVHATSCAYLRDSAPAANAAEMARATLPATADGLFNVAVAFARSPGAAVHDPRLDEGAREAARSAHAGQAVELLRDARAGGHVLELPLAEEPLLAGLRGDPRFEELAREWRTP
jgi:hypothetical protein